MVLEQPLVWIDLETTGLEVEKNVILEVACMITDGKLETTVEGPNMIIKRPDDVLLNMSDWCWQQHNKTGLVQLCRSKEAVNVQDAEKTILQFVKQHVPNKNTAFWLAVRSILTKNFLEKRCRNYFPIYITG